MKRRPVVGSVADAPSFHITGNSLIAETFDANVEALGFHVGLNCDFGSYFVQFPDGEHLHFERFALVDRQIECEMVISGFLMNPAFADNLCLGECYIVYVSVGARAIKDACLAVGALAVDSSRHPKSSIEGARGVGGPLYCYCG